MLLASIEQSSPSCLRFLRFLRILRTSFLG
jgi:hypothetical protein